MTSRVTRTVQTSGKFGVYTATYETVEEPVTLTDFLLARIAEDEEDLCHCCDDGLGTVVGFARADLEAKRRIILDDGLAPFLDAEGRRSGQVSKFGHRILTYLALPYADHPDYREAWRP